MKKRIISMLLLVAMAISMLPSTIIRANAASTSQPIISVAEVLAATGSTVEVDVKISGNPGILGATLTLSWAEGLTLVEAEEGDAFAGLTYQEPSRYESAGTNFIWYGTRLKTVQDGTVLKMIFRVSEDVTEGSKLAVNISGSGITDIDKNSVTAIFVGGGIQVINYTPGDVDDSGEIDPLDLIILAKYISDGCKTDPDGYNVTPNVKASDVNDDGEYTPLDLILISQYISDGCTTDPDGYNVILKPSTPKCEHALQEIPYKAATCEEDGNARYWHCTKCEKYFGRDGTEPIEDLSQVILPATGHTEVTIPGKEPTYDEPGYTESKKCSTCGKVLVESVELPKLEKNTVNIVYRLEGREQDQYLINFLKDKDMSTINPNEKEHPNGVYDTTKQGYTLKGVGSVIPGYIFKGWVDAFGDPFRTIEKGQTGSVEIYATWEKIEYEIIFDVYDADIELSKDQKTTYTVDKGAPLKSLEKYGYIFVGWSTDDGFLINEIEPGTVGPVTVHANWTADRNIATSYPSYDAPIIIEDAQNGQILFVYNIGKIDKVPLNVIPGTYFHNMGVTEFVETLSITNAVDSAMVEGINKMISNATTRSSGWTLTNEWNDMYTSTETVGTLQEKSDERTTKQGQVVGGKYFVSNSEGGSTHVSDESGGSNFKSSKVTTDKSVGIGGSYDKTKEKYCDAQLGVKTHLGGSVGVGAEAGIITPIPIGAATGSVNGSISVDGSIDGEAGIQNGRKDKSAFHIDGSYSKYTGTVDYEEESNYYNSTSSQDSNWNSTAGYEQSWESSTEQSITQAIKTQLSKSSEHSISKAVGQTNSETQSKQDTFTNAEEYNTTFTYGTTDTTSTTKTVTQTFTEPGYYRYITVGTIHVYGVVGYDIATASYYTYSFNVLDNQTEQTWDYSKNDQTFQDCNNGVVTFNIPYDIAEYVAGFVGKTNGLEISYDGVVTGFEPSTSTTVDGEFMEFDGTVAVPMYDAKDDLNGEYTAVKVTSFSPDAFKDVKDSLETLILPSYITEIPDNAFEGFTKLETVIAYGVTQIGANAFAGCTSLEKFYVDTAITHLGENAFRDVEEIAVAAYDSAVAMAAIRSGAKRITLNIGKMNDSFDNWEIVIGDDGDDKNGVEVTPDYFALIGGGKTYNNLKIISKAKETMINSIKFANNTSTPIELESENILLANMSVEDSPAFALIMKKDANVQLLGDVDLKTTSGNTVLSRNVTFSKANQGTSSYLYVNDGKYLVCGEVTNKSFIYDYKKDGKKNVAPTVITEDEYQKYLSSCIISFDANGGTVDIENKAVYFGQTYGELPIPERTGWSFVGWFTEATGGTQIKADDVVKNLVDRTLYARWSAMAYTATWNSGEGYTIIVNRTESPYTGAATGELKSGAEVFYGDKLSITYTASTGYSLNSKGSESVTVTGNVTASTIYATATLNSYTYNVVYKSSNGTNLGSTTVTYKYGTTNTITPPAKSGYDTPAAQSVTWDSTSAKTITFTYSPSYVATSQHLTSGTWWNAPTAGTGITYSVSAEYRNRTANSVEVRIVWTQSIKQAAYGYNQYFYCSMWNNGSNRGNTGNVKIASTSTWPKYSNSGPWHTSSVTAYSAWITIPLDSTDSHGIEIACDWWTEGSGQSGSWAGKMIYVPAY